MKNINDLLLALSLLALSICQTNAQGWEQTYDFNDSEAFGAIALRPNGGFTLLNYQGVFASLLHESYLMGTDQDGETEWEKEVSFIVSGKEILPAPDDGYYILGTQIIDFAVSASAGLIKVDAQGNVEWEELYVLDPDNLYHYATAGIVNPDGTILMGGSMDDGTGSFGNTFLLKIDENGNLLWSQIFNGEDIGGIRQIFHTTNGYLLAGFNGGLGLTGDAQFSLARIDENGNLLWANQWSDPKPFHVHTAMLTDGEVMFVAADTTTSLEPGVLVSKADQNGNVLWEIEMATSQLGLGTNFNTTVESIVPTADGGAVVVLWEGNSSAVVKLDSEGSVEWYRLFLGELGNEIKLFDVKQAADGGYVAAGGKNTGGFMEFTAYLVRLDANGNLYDNFISGKIYSDDDEDCEPGTSEVGASGRIVKVESTNFTWYATSDADGNYALDVPTATLDVSLVAHPYVSSCPASTQVIFATSGETATADFGLQDTLFCPLLDVSIASWRMRPCFEANYSGEVCNIGTATAEGATLEIELDQWLDYLSASLPLLSQNGQTLVFDLGDLEAGECTSFSIDYLLDCDAPDGITHCTEAHAFPDSLCLPIDPIWDGSSIVVSGECVDEDSIRFTILNMGDIMQEASNFIVIEDHMIQLNGDFQLLMDEDLPVTLAATGGTFRLEAEQCPGHPGFSHPSVTVEGCGLGQGLTISTGIVNQYPQDDADYWLDIDCRQNTNSYDPNDKQASPTGALSQHYFHPNTDLEYFIRFQNTGTDTAINVAIRDTLSPHLDPGSIRPGAASHPYEFELLGQGVAVFRFADIMLPDSNVNEPLSNGFITFRISQQPDLPDGTVIENSAAIFFDFNAPIITNQTWHTVQRDFLLLTSVEAGSLGHLPQVKVYPNPVAETAFFEVKNVENEEVTLLIFDQTGRQVHTVNSASQPIELRRGELPAGLYFFKMETANGVLGSGKFVVVR